MREISLAGNYALRLRGSDNHDSGLFTWRHLRAISDALNGRTQS
ncbi:MAG: gamma-butyrobetaine hydroxylase-like domain-containing protein [Planctomyces sp.]